MADTLSRKHRLKQQQHQVHQQQQQQFLRNQTGHYGGKNSNNSDNDQVAEFRNGRSAGEKQRSNLTKNGRQRKRMTAVEDDDDDGFEVFKVVEVGTNTCHEKGREEFCQKTRTKQQRLNSSVEQRELRNNHFSSRRTNFKGDVNSVRTTDSGGQIERRNENDFGHDDCEEDGDADYNHHHPCWREHSYYEPSNHSQQQQQQRAREGNYNHQLRDGGEEGDSPEIPQPNHATSTSNHYQSKSLSTLNGSSTTKSIGGNSSSGFSSSNGSYSSSSQQQHNNQHHHHHRHRQQPIHENDCGITRVSNNTNNNNKQQSQSRQRGQPHGHEGAMGKRSKLIDDLDRLLMPPDSEKSSRVLLDDASSRCSTISRLVSNNNNEQRRRRSSLASPTESHISTVTTTSSHHPSAAINARGHKTAPNFTASDTANDFDYSTLCRDEFSSFIQIEPPLKRNFECHAVSTTTTTTIAAAAAASQSPELKDSGCGPMLIGIHETESSNVRRLAYPRHDDHDGGGGQRDCDDISFDGPESGEVEPYNEFRVGHFGGNDDDDDDHDDHICDNVYEEIPGSVPSSIDDRLSSLPVVSTSPSCSSTAEINNPCSPIVCQNYSPGFDDDSDDADGDGDQSKSLDSTDSRAMQSQSMMMTGNECDDLSRMLDIYLERVNSLIRLTKSDKSLSIQEAFKSDDDDDYRKDHYFEVRAEHRTPVAFVAHSGGGGRENFMRIIQEVEYEHDETEAAVGHRIEAVQDCHRTIVTRVNEHFSDELSSWEKNHQQELEESIRRRPLKSILESIQISPELNWSRRSQRKEEENVCDIFANGLVSGKTERTTDIRYLEESLISRLGLSDNHDADYDGYRDVKIPVSIIREHMKEFIENYHTYQTELSQDTSFGDGSWHENWLFASKRPRSSVHQSEPSKIHEVSCAKRAKFSSRSSDQQSSESTRWRRQEDQENENYEGHSPCEKADLIKYSTLILAKCKPVKLTLTSNDNKGSHHYRLHQHESGQQQQLKGRPSDITRHIESLYEAQLERVSELELVAIESSRQTDVCRLLVRDTDDDNDCDDDSDTMDSNNNNSKRKTRPSQGNKSLLVSYDSTSLRPALHHANMFHFTASGYLFQTSLIKFPIGSSKLRANLERNILDKLISCVGEQSSSPSQQRMTVKMPNRLPTTRRSESHARFVISLSNIELINKLPVIQFCAKISGSLPIRVRWFRKLPDGSGGATPDHHHQHRYEELSDISNGAKRKNLNIRSMADRHSQWPIELQASYDYEYETSSASWFRFRRNKDDILFEIREPSLATDYNRVYKCLVENVSSCRECKFQLTTKRVVNSSTSSSCDRQTRQPQPLAKNRRAAAASVDGNDGHALLRTWSQRTLNKPQPLEPKVPADAEQMGRLAPAGRHQTVGRLSASTVDEDKFGKNFPYHPENLLKRLEENKFSIPAKRKLVTAAAMPLATMNDCHLTSSDLLLESGEPAWSNSKILIDDEVESYHPKELQRKKEQLALASNSNSNSNSGLNSAHADPMQFDSHRLIANKNNFGCHSSQENVIADCNDDSERVQQELQGRPRVTVINPRPLNRVNSVCDSASRLNAAAQQSQMEDSKSQTVESSDGESARTTASRNSAQQVPNQQPRPRQRLSQTAEKFTNSDVANKEQDQNENFRPIEHSQPQPAPNDQTNYRPTTTTRVADQKSDDATTLSFSQTPPNNSAARSNESSQVFESQQSDTAAKLTDNDDADGRGDGTKILPPLSDRPKSSGTNVKSLISRFSLA